MSRRVLYRHMTLTVAVAVAAALCVASGVVPASASTPPVVAVRLVGSHYGIAYSRENGSKPLALYYRAAGASQHVNTRLNDNNAALVGHQLATVSGHPGNEVVNQINITTGGRTVLERITDIDTSFFAGTGLGSWLDFTSASTGASPRFVRRTGQKVRSYPAPIHPNVGTPFGAADAAGAVVVLERASAGNANTYEHIYYLDFSSGQWTHLATQTAGTIPVLSPHAIGWVDQAGRLRRVGRSNPAATPTARRLPTHVALIAITDSASAWVYQHVVNRAGDGPYYVETASTGGTAVKVRTPLSSVALAAAGNGGFVAPFYTSAPARGIYRVAAGASRPGAKVDSF
jgi:hypothetical protein